MDEPVKDITSLFDFEAPGGNLAFPGGDKLPLGLTAAVIDGNQLPIGPVTEPIYLVHSDAGAVNTAPISNGITDVTVTEGADDTAIALFDVFDDAQDADSALTYEVIGNTNAGLFATAPAINPTTGVLTLDYAATGTGTADVTVRATDTEGLFTEETFTVSVNALPPVGSTIRIEAEDYRAGTNGAEFFDSTTGNIGGAYRPDEPVDIQSTKDTGGGFNVGWIKSSSSPSC